MSGAKLILPLRLLAVVLIAGLGLTACGRGPFAPEAQAQYRALEHYVRLLSANLTVDDTFEWNTLSSALIVRALPYNTVVSQAASARFAGDPTFAAETAGWGSAGHRSNRTVVVLLGLFTPDLAEKDLTKLGRFRPRLLAADGRILEPVEIKRYGRDAVFIRDHFPVFNSWEDVYLVRFAASGLQTDGRLEFRLEWPGGVQTLWLNEPGTSGD